MIVIGIGSQSTASIADISAAIAAAEASVGCSCGLVATLARGGPDAAIERAAAMLGRRVTLLLHAELSARVADCATRSEASLEAYGLPSVAEAAALAAAGPGSRLILPRLRLARATAAVAQSASAASS